eukprot:scaffold931_cov383-Prasinococcus_capsulatus_cf.AAC.20
MSESQRESPWGPSSGSPRTPCRTCAPAPLPLDLSCILGGPALDGTVTAQRARHAQGSRPAAGGLKRQGHAYREQKRGRSSSRRHGDDGKAKGQKYQAVVNWVSGQPASVQGSGTRPCAGRVRPLASTCQVCTHRYAPVVTNSPCSLGRGKGVKLSPRDVMAYSMAASPTIITSPASSSSPISTICVQYRTDTTHSWLLGH